MLLHYIVHSRHGRAADAVAAASVCIVGRRSSTAPAATTVDGDAVSAGPTQAYIGIGIGLADIATAISGYRISVLNPYWLFSKVECLLEIRQGGHLPV